MKVTEQAPACTDAPPHVVVDQLRAPNLDIVRITPQAGLGTTPLKPRPTPPQRPLTARPLPRDVHIPSAPYGPISVTRAELDQQMADAGIDRIGQPAAWSAFGGAA